MPKITINLDEDIQKILSGRAKKNLLTLKEQIEDILRISAVRSKTSAKHRTIKPDDLLVEVFSRQKSGRKPKRKN
ncbi:MAG: hypothetical protein Q8P57_00605 [Candidatus Pacearchaeota archaeon]|nr:hypothetical protein [Candidatus Pacearchaeota archaeon]